MKHGFPQGPTFVNTESAAREGEGTVVLRVEYDDPEPDPTPEEFGLPP